MVILEGKRIYKYPICNEVLSSLSSFTNEILSVCAARIAEEETKPGVNFSFTCLVLILESDDRLL